MRKTTYSLAPIERLIRKSGAERVSPEAVQYLSEFLEDVTTDLASQAADVARHAKRKTISSDDIKLVTRQ